jgi:hypothetical protein
MNENVEVTDIDEHSSSLRFGINYNCKVFLKYKILNMIDKSKS